MAAQNGLIGRIGKRLQSGLDATKSGSFDIRNTQAGARVSSGLGVNLNQKPLNILSGIGLGMGTDQTKGGYDAEVKRREKELEKQENLLKEKMTDTQIKAYNSEQKEKRENKIDALAFKDMAAEFGKATVQEWRKNNRGKYEEQKAIALEKAEVKEQVGKIPPIKELGSVKEITNKRRKRFGEGLKKESWLTGLPIIEGLLGEQAKIAGNILATEKLDKEFKETEKDRLALAALEKAEKQRNRANDELEHINKNLQGILESTTDPRLFNKKVDDLTIEERDLLKLELKKGRRAKEALVNELNTKISIATTKMQSAKDEKDFAKHEAEILNLNMEKEQAKNDLEDYNDENIWEKKEKAEEKLLKETENFEKRQKAKNDLDEAKGNRKKEEKAEEKKP